MISELPESVSLNDAAGFPLAALGAIVATGIGSVTLYGHNLGGSVSEVGMSIAAVLYLVSFGVAWITNDRSLDDFASRGQGRETEELLVLIAPVLLIAHEQFTEINNAVTGNDFLATTVALVLIGAYALVAHY